MTWHFWTCTLLVLAVPTFANTACEDDDMSHLQLKESSRNFNALQVRSNLHSRLTLLENNLFWQGYGGDSLASYFIGFLGRDTVRLGDLSISTNVGVNLMGNVGPKVGNYYQSVQADAGVLGLLPGCFNGGCRPEDYDDFLSIMARERKIHRAFTLCFDTAATGGGRLFLGRPQIPVDAMRIPLHPLVDGLHPYAPLATGSTVDFFFGQRKVGSRRQDEWNQLVRSGVSYTDTGTPGFLLPSSILQAVLQEIRQGILEDELCTSIWGPYLQSFVVNHLHDLILTSAAATCAEKFLEDFAVDLGPEISLTVSKSSFFYETQPCSNQLRISWLPAASDAFIFGTAFNWGKNVLYDSTSFESPEMILLGPAENCKVSWSEAQAPPEAPVPREAPAVPREAPAVPREAPASWFAAPVPREAPVPGAGGPHLTNSAVELQGLPSQVLGGDGMMKAHVSIGSPPQEIALQVDTASQKLISIHPQCHTVGFCFLVQPENSTSTALLPGPDYGTAMCQQQVQVLTQTLATVSVCSEWKSKILCECHTQEECLGRILNAAMKFASESCASERKACGEKIDFEPALSRSFSPDFGPFSNFAGETSGRTSLAEQKQCQLYHLCKKTPEPHIDVAGNEEMGRLPSAKLPEKASSAVSEGAVPPDYPKFPAGNRELPSANLPEKASSALSEGAVPPDYPKFPAGNEEMDRLPSAKLPEKASSALSEGAVPPDYPKFPAGNEEMERLPSAKLPEKASSAVSEGAVPPDYPKFPAGNGEMERLPSANLPEKASSALSEGAVPPDYPKFPAGNEEMERLPSAKLPEKASSAVSEGAVPPDYPKFPAGNEEMEGLPSAKLPQKKPSALSEGAVPPDYPKFPAGNEMERLPSAKFPQKTPSALSEGVVLPETWLPDIDSLNPTGPTHQWTGLDGLSTKMPGLSVQISEALSGVSVDTGHSRDTGSMSDSFKEKLPLNMGEQSGLPELPPEVQSVAENPTFWTSHPLKNPNATESSKLQQSTFSPSATPSPTEISLFPMDDLATSS